MEAMATGSWLTRERVIRVAFLFALASFLSIAALFATARGTLDYQGRPLGTDFSNVWAAGKMALDGSAAKAWSWPDHFAVQRVIHHKADVDVFGWHYPPPFLLVAAGLALLPYVSALVLWQLATLIPLTAFMWRLVPRRETILLTLAAPVTLICLTHGQNGFLTALLLGAGLALLDRRPLLAGLLMGSLVYKPQFAIILPVLLLAGRHWRAICGALLGCLFWTGVTYAIWGTAVWQAFFGSLALTRTVVIEQGSTGFYKIMSPFAAVRLWGGSIATAYCVQLVFTAAAIGAVAWVAGLRQRPDLRNALVCAAALVSTPYVLDYDLVALLPALAWLWADGQKNRFMRWDATLMAVTWIALLSARQVAQFAYVPLGLIVILLIGSISLRRITASPSRRSREAFAL